MFDDLKILVVDDDYAIRQLTRRVLTSMTFSVETADSLAGGLDKIQDADMLLLDLRLKNGKGDTLLQRWRDEHRGPIVIMSGYVDRALENELLEGYVDNVLHKPVLPSVLRSVFQRLGKMVLDAKKCSKNAARIDLLTDQLARLQRRVWLLTGAALGLGLAAGLGVDKLSVLLGGI